MELRPGARLDRYTLVTPLGEGGQGAVWKVIDPLDGGIVRALKVFQLRGTSATGSERARREAKSVAGIRHPGILRCLTLFEDPEHEVLGLVFDYVRGRSLASALTDPRLNRDLRRAAVRQIADILAYVHSREIVHRDVKPDNVLVVDDFWTSPTTPGTLKLLDFGIAAPAGNPSPLTQAGGIVGTAPYLAPELLEPGNLFESGGDFSRDIFAFGVLAWEVLVGGHPTGLPLGASRDAFAGVYLGARAGNRNWPPQAPPVADLPIVRQCLSLQAGERPVSCVPVVQALGGGVHSRESLSPQSPKIPAPRSSGTDVHVPPHAVSEAFAAPAARPATGAAPQRSSIPAHTSQPSIASYQPPQQVQLPVQIDPTLPYRPSVVIAPPVPNTSNRKRAAFKLPRAWMGWALVAILPTVILVVAIAVYISQGNETSASVSVPFSAVAPQPTRPTFAIPTKTLLLPAPEPKPSNTATRSEAPLQVTACCGDSGECRSGRECVATCQTLPEAVWRLRVVGGFIRTSAGPREIQREWQTSQICIKNTRTGEAQCANSYDMWTKGSDATHRVAATTSDLKEGNLMVWVINNGAYLQPPIRAFGASEGYRTTALCMGVVLHFGSYSENVEFVTVHLD